MLTSAALLLGTLAIAGVSACSPGASGAANAQTPAAPAMADARHPVSGLQVIDLTVERASDPSARPIALKVELAASPEAQARGLMFRTQLGDNEGMIFPSEAPEPRSFWMKNTPLSLDIIFIGPDGRISNIAAATTPYSLDSVRSSGLASAVLELRAGRAKALGIGPGDLVRWAAPR